MRSALTFPRIREAPEDLLERLRAVDPTAELLYWGPRLADVDVGGRNVTVVVPVWVLGTVRPNGLRQRTGARLLQTQERLGARGNRDTWQYARLLYQHFAPIHFYPVRDPSSAIVEDFRLRTWLLHHALAAEEQRALEEAEGLPQLELKQQQIVDKVRAEGVSDWHFHFAKRRFFS